MGFARLLIAALSALAVIAAAGCGASHLMLAMGVEIADLGPATLVPLSAPALALDGERVFFLQATVDSLPVVARSVRTLADATLFKVPAGSVLWGMNPRAGTLIFTVPVAGSTKRIAEYALNGQVVRQYGVPGGFQDVYASISPDGDSLAFIRIDTSNGSFELKSRSTSSGSSPISDLGNYFLGQAILSVGWSNRLVFVSLMTSSGDAQNWLHEGNQARIVAGHGYYAAPDPSATHVASIMGASGSQGVVLQEPGGGNATDLTPFTGDRLSLRWSGDGRKLVYETLTGSAVSSLEVVSLPPLR